MKLGIVGTGQVGCAIALTAVTRGSAREIVLVNRTRKTADAVATDIRYGTPLCDRVEIGDADYGGVVGGGGVLLPAGVHDENRRPVDRHGAAAGGQLPRHNACLLQESLAQS